MWGHFFMLNDHGPSQKFPEITLGAKGLNKVAQSYSTATWFYPQLP